MTRTVPAAASLVPASARGIAAEWRRLARPDAGPKNQFDPQMVAGLPEPARRWLTHAVAPGTPLWRAVELTGSGRIRLAGWRPFGARQLLAEDGFIWAATARVGVARIAGFDRYSAGTGEMRWRLFGALPLATAAGADVTRSAAGRFAAERVSLLPTAFRGVTWTPGGPDGTVRATVRVGGRAESVDLTVGEDGSLRRVLMQRWGNPDRRGFRLYPFGVTVEAEETFDGITLMSAFRAGWWVGTEREDEGEFFRCVITASRPVEQP